MITTVALRLVPIVLLAIGLIHPLPLAVDLLLLAVLGWWLVGPAARKPLRSAQPLAELPPAREPLEPPLPSVQAQHDQRILELQQQLEAGRARELTLSRQLRQWQQEAQASRQANQQLERQRQQLQQDLQSCEALLEEQQTSLDQLQASQKAQELQLNEARSTIVQLEREQAQSQAATGAVLERGPAATGTLLLNSSERDLYPRERQELLLTLLRLAVADQATGCRGLTPSPRTLDILNDLIAQNPLQGQRPSQQFSNSIKQAFRAETSIRLQQNLRPLGFECTQATNGHIIVAVRGDDRYKLQVSSTPSDNHSRQNEAGRLMKMLLSRTTA